MANWLIEQTIDLRRGYNQAHIVPDALMADTNTLAHTWRLKVLDGGVSTDLSGAVVTGQFLRADGVTVQVAGTVLGDTVSVTLAQPCYAVQGRLTGSIRMVMSGRAVTLATAIFMVRAFTSGEVVNPGVSYQDFVINAAPAGAYASFAALSAAVDTDKSRIYVTKDTGRWYYWDGTQWVLGGEYQAMADKSISIAKLDESLIKRIGSKNLYDRSLVMDGYLINNNPAIPTAAYPDGILSGYVPVEIGKKYIVSNGPGLYLRSLHFFDDGAAKCAQRFDGNYYGVYPGGYYWPSCSGMVDIVWQEQDRVVFEILPGSGITHVMWYITNSKTDNYYGPHAGLLASIIARVQMNEGDTLYAHDIYTAPQVKVQNNALEGDPYGVLFTRQGDVLQVRSRFDNTNDIAIRWKIGGSGNKHLNLHEMVNMPIQTAPNVATGGGLWKSCSDDITPLHFNGSYIGANHGYNAAWTLTSPAHGLTTTSIGQTWTDAGGRGYVILSVPSSDTLFVCSTFTGNESAPLSTTAPATSLTRSGTTKMLSAVSAIQQLTPAINRKSWAVHVDGIETDYGVDGYAKGEYVDVVETYDIIHIPSMLTFLAANGAANRNNSYYSDEIAERYCRVSNIYRHTRDGAMTVYASVDFFRDVDFNFAGLIQSSTIGQYMYVPGTTFSVVSQQSGTQSFGRAAWTDPDAPPNRYYQFAAANADKGMALGYCPDVALGDKAKRLADNAGMYYSSYKMYPYLVNGADTANTLKSISAVAYRVPLMKRDLDLTALCWYWVGDDIYLNIEAHKTLDKLVSLPAYMAGRKVRIMDKSSGITIPQGVVASSGLRVIVSGAGSAVVRLER